MAARISPTNGDDSTTAAATIVATARRPQWTLPTRARRHANRTVRQSCRELSAWKEAIMPQGDKGKYTDKQKRQAEHIEEGYVERGLSEDEAERRAWATVNKVHHGGEKPGGGGYGKSENHEPMRKGGRNSHS